jgi:penicillin-insensitive murein endopeptidase
MTVLSPVAGWAFLGPDPDRTPTQKPSIVRGAVGRRISTLVLACLFGCAGSQNASRAGNADPKGPPTVAAPSQPCPAGEPCPPAGAPTAAEDEAPEDEEPDDGIELDPEAPAASGTAAAITLTDAEIEDRLRRDPASLGAMSIGLASAGLLVNGVQMPQSDRWVTVDGGNAWGTRETVDYLTRAIDAVHARFADTPKMYIGHISGRRGGHLSPHVSHQAGRDVDVSYYLLGNHAWYARATANNLDRARTWAFVRALITDTDVELILIDSSVQRLLKDHAIAIGEPREWLDEVFQIGSKTARPMVRHAKGHATHIHVRFYSPQAQELGRRAFPLMVKLGQLKQRSLDDQRQQTLAAGFITHRARSGDTLGSLSRRYGVSVESIQRANNLRGTAIRAKNTYRIPKKGAPVHRPRKNAGPTLQAGPVIVPPRRLPPDASPSGTKG